MKTIALLSEKGGVGKTTLAVHLAAGLAVRGKRVLLVDADPQGHATMSFGIKPKPAFYEVLVEGRGWESSIAAPTLDAYGWRLNILPGNIDTRKAASRVKANALEAVLDGVAEAYDVSIVDTGPTPGDLMALVYAAADLALIPVVPEYLALDGLVKTAQRATQAGVEVAGVIPNLVKRQATHEKNLEALAARWPLWDSVYDRADFREASQHRCTVWMLYPKRTAARQMWALVERVESLL